MDIIANSKSLERKRPLELPRPSKQAKTWLVHVDHVGLRNSRAQGTINARFDQSFASRGYIRELLEVTVPQSGHSEVCCTCESLAMLYSALVEVERRFMTRGDD